MTRAQALRQAAARLKAAGIDEASDDARRLMAHAAGLEAAELIATTGKAISADEQARFNALITRRENREPLSHILGRVAFWTLHLKVTPDVLTPRPDTETLVEAALAAIKDRSAPLRLLDIGTGSGAIALALLSELPNAVAVATDLSTAALAVATENAQACSLQTRFHPVQTSWVDGLAGPFDLIVSNPPYIASAVIEALDPEVKDFEPALALDGGTEGLDPYPWLLAEARRLLRREGRAFFEIGFDQGASVSALAEGAGAHVERIKDLAGRDRVIALQFRLSGDA